MAADVHTRGRIKVWVALVAWFWVAVGMVGPAHAQSKDVELTMWVNCWVQEAIDSLQHVADMFVENDPYVKAVDVQVVCQGDLAERLILGVASGTSPDLITFPSPAIAYQMSGLITPLDRYVDVSTVVRREDYPEGIFDAFTVDGTLYGVPAVEVAPGLILIYNKRMFLESGFSEEGPATLDEVVAMHRKLSRFSPDGEGLERLGIDPLGAMAGQYFTEIWEAIFDIQRWYDESNYTVDVAAFEPAFDYIAAIYEIPGYDDIVNTGLNGWTGAIATGNLGMQINGAWVPGELMASGNPTQDDLGYTWMPSVKGDRATASLPWALGIPQGAPNADHAFRLIEAFTTPEAAQTIFDATGWLNGNLPALRALYPGEVPEIVTIMNMFDMADRFVVPRQIPLIDDVRSALVGAARDIASGAEGVRATLEETQRLIDARLREALQTE